jgi:hypothetical protein
MFSTATMILPRNCKSKTNLVASSSDTFVVTHAAYTNNSMLANGTTNFGLEQPTSRGLSSEAIIAIALGLFVIVSTWVNHFFTMHMNNGMWSRMWF